MTSSWTDLAVQILREGQKLEVAGFGVFSLYDYPAYVGRDPRTGEAVPVPAKRVPRFARAPELHASLNGGPPIPATALRGPGVTPAVAAMIHEVISSLPSGISHPLGRLGWFIARRKEAQGGSLTVVTHRASRWLRDAIDGQTRPTVTAERFASLVARDADRVITTSALSALAAARGSTFDGFTFETGSKPEDDDLGGVTFAARDDSEGESWRYCAEHPPAAPGDPWVFAVRPASDSFHEHVTTLSGFLRAALLVRDVRETAGDALLDEDQTRWVLGRLREWAPRIGETYCDLPY